MVQLIVGTKGSGKTKRMVDELNQLAQEGKNVVCIEHESRLGHSIKYTVRLIDSSEYPIHGYPELLGFLAGLCAKDYDIDAIYIDSIQKITGTQDKEALAQFLDQLEPFVSKMEKNLDVRIMLSADVTDLPESVLKFQI